MKQTINLTVEGRTSGLQKGYTAIEMIDDYYVPVDKLRIQDVDITGSFNQITYGVPLGSKVCDFSGTEII